jgi:hypothetical protein
MGESIVIDMRTAQQYLAARQPGSIFVGFTGGDFKGWLMRILPDKDCVLR